MKEREALEYLVGLAATEVIEINGERYTSKKVHRVEDPIASAIKTSTLTSIVDYIKSNINDMNGKKLIIHIESPRRVTLLTELNKDRERECLIIADAMLPNNIEFDRFIDTERFNIMLQSSFVKNTDRELLLKVTGCVKDSAIKEIGDDGVSQAATIKTGVASVNDVKVPNPVIIAPYRTFPEVDQPESKFIFRMQSGPKAALFEADGGQWRNLAMNLIKDYFEDRLDAIENVSIIS